MSHLIIQLFIELRENSIKLYHTATITELCEVRIPYYTFSRIFILLLIAEYDMRIEISHGADYMAT